MKNIVLYTKRVTIILLQIVFGLVCLVPFVMAILSYNNPRVYVEISDVIVSFMLGLGIAAIINVPLFFTINRLFHIKLEINTEKIKFYHPKRETVGIAWNEINDFFVDYIKTFRNIELYEIADGMRSIRFYRMGKKPKNIEQNRISLLKLEAYSNKNYGISLSGGDCDKLIRYVYLYAQKEPIRKSELVSIRQTIKEAS